MAELEIIIVSLYGAAWLLLLAAVLVLGCQVSSLRKKVKELASGPVMRVQRATMNSNHAFHNPALSPDEELSKRGYSMYVADEDVESGRGTARQTGGEFVEELSRELESRQHRQHTNAPPFLLQAIQEKRRSRELAQSHANFTGNHGNPAGNHGNAAGNQGNAAGNHGNAAGNHGNPVGNHGNRTGNNSNPFGNGNPISNHGYPVSYSNSVGNYSNSVGNYNNSVGNHANHDSKGNRIIRQSSYPKTRQSDTNPNFIY